MKPESGRAGASAQKEFERRHQKREAVLDQRFGHFAGLVKFLVDDPQSTRAWAKGSEGERLLAEALTRRVGDRAVLLHDRKIPRTTANIDILAIAATGAWIIDAKKYKGRLERRDKGGWRTIDYHVYVNGRDQSKLAGGLHKQAAVVRAALGDLDVPIHSVLCFIEAEWDFFLKPFQVDDVWVTYGKHLAEMIAAAGPLSDDEVLRVANVLAAALPPKAH
ncbi:MAG: nuclease-related domain-containing protein [Acidimicrobiales bacterium]